MLGNEHKVDLTKEFLSSRFSMKDIGEADVILGIRIKHESNGIAIYQSHYIEKVLKKFNYFDCTPVSTLIDTSLILLFVVGKLSKYTSNPGTQHLQAIQRVLKYLKKTIDYKLTYTGYPLVLEGYTDASWISNSKDNSSTTLATAGKEAGWLRNLILKIPLWSKPIAPISIRCDSAATLAKAYSQMYNGKLRQLCVRHSMIHELIMNEKKQWNSRIKKTVHAEAEAEAEAEAKTMIYCLPESAIAVAESAAVVTRI
ncbi:zinc finger, CCHC-type containing protein [Tanacetum coccineum]